MGKVEFLNLEQVDGEAEQDETLLGGGGRGAEEAALFGGTWLEDGLGFWGVGGFVGGEGFLVDVM